MKKIRSFFRSPMGTTFLFMLAVLMLTTGTIGGVRATPQIFNPDFYYGGVELQAIGVSLIENENKIVSYRNYNKDIQDFDKSTGKLLEDMFQGTPADNLILGYPYTEGLSVRNTGMIPEYVRVSVYKYWEDGAGNKVDNLPLDFIDLTFLTGNGWVIDQANDDPNASESDSNTNERTVLYYQYPLNSNANTNPFTETLTISPDLIDYAKKEYINEGDETAWRWVWLADGLTFQIEVDVDAVQNHNAKAAMKSAWGITDGDIDRLGLIFGEEET